MTAQLFETLPTNLSGCDIRQRMRDALGYIDEHSTLLTAVGKGVGEALVYGSPAGIIPVAGPYLAGKVGDSVDLYRICRGCILFAGDKMAQISGELEEIMSAARELKRAHSPLDQSRQAFKESQQQMATDWQGSGGSALQGYLSRVVEAHSGLMMKLDDFAASLEDVYQGILGAWRGVISTLEKIKLDINPKDIWDTANSIKNAALAAFDTFLAFKQDTGKAMFKLMNLEAAPDGMTASGDVESGKGDAWGGGCYMLPVLNGSTLPDGQGDGEIKDKFTPGSGQKLSVQIDDLRIFAKKVDAQGGQWRSAESNLSRVHELLMKDGVFPPLAQDYAKRCDYLLRVYRATIVAGPRVLTNTANGVDRIANAYQATDDHSAQKVKATTR